MTVLIYFLRLKDACRPVRASNFTEKFGEDDLTITYRIAAAEIKDAMNKYLYSQEQKRFLRTINFNNGNIETDLNIDASMFAIFEFGTYDIEDEKVTYTMKAIRDHLWCKTDTGGVARYQNDYYHRISNDGNNIPGNPWFICTLMAR